MERKATNPSPGDTVWGRVFTVVGSRLTPEGSGFAKVVWSEALVGWYVAVGLITLDVGSGFTKENSLARLSCVRPP
jgi:hypothetical protein